MPEAVQRFSVITDRSLAELRKLINVPIEDSLEPWCFEASRDSVRHWAHGIGDDNPLWCDPGYAANTDYGRLLAPPSFIFPLNRSFSGYVGGLAGVHAMFAGIDVTWHRAMMLGDAFTTKVWLKDLVEHETRFAGRSIQQIYRCEFYNQNRELVAEGDSWCFRTERDTARERGTKYDEVKKKAQVHYTRDELATLVGTPAAYDYGPERCSWMSHHLTNWMGDRGFLRRLEVKIRRHNPVGDTLYINGEVKRTFTEEGAHYAEITQRATNQDGELSVLANGIVRLPWRGRR